MVGWGVWVGGIPATTKRPRKILTSLSCVKKDLVNCPGPFIPLVDPAPGAASFVRWKHGGRESLVELSGANLTFLLQHHDFMTVLHVAVAWGNRYPPGLTSSNLFHYVNCKGQCCQLGPSGVSRIGKSHSKPGVELTTARYQDRRYSMFC